MRFITKQLHSYLDYPVAFALIALPFLLDLGSSNSLAFYLSVVTGVAALSLTILTDHQTGLLKVIPYRLHLLVDGAVAVVFLLAPFIFGFEGIDAIFYWANGAAVLLVVSLHKSEVKKPIAIV
tara:strand:+ start:15427 stop:15795 length:369 start_codon:yes stop_codon:yes gene_type:complete